MTSLVLPHGHPEEEEVLHRRPQKQELDLSITLDVDVDKLMHSGIEDATVGLGREQLDMPLYQATS